MKRRQILLNALTTFAQIACNAAILFFLYRFLVHSIGLAGLGVWSLVLATTSVVALANQGFSTSIVKFVAKYAARESPADVSSLVQTAELSLGVGLGLLLVLLYPAAKWGLALILPRANLPAACEILPYAVASLWINVTASVLQAGLAGHEFITECNYVDVGGSALYFILALVLVPLRGLLGLGYAQLAQAIACFLAIWALLRRRIAGLPVVPRKWSLPLFREMVGYGAHFQLITASQSLREPVTKALLTKFAGPAMTGLYDMSSRLVVTLRECLVQANQVLIPTVSGLQERDPAAVPEVYTKSYRLIFYLAIPTFTLLVIVSPFVSSVWLGRYDPLFVEFVTLLAAGWLVNVLSNPAYVIGLGTGSLRWVSVGCGLTAILNATLGLAGGRLFGATAIVVAAALSLAAGYTIILAAYHLEHRVPFRALIPPHSTGIVTASVAAAIAFIPFFHFGRVGLPFSPLVALGIGGVLLAVIIPMWMHPMRRRLWNWIMSRAAV